MRDGTICSVLLIEDNLSECKLLLDAVRNFDNLNIIGYTGDSEEAKAFISLHKPFALILDLELNMGGGTGLDILEWLPVAGLPYKPYILITTNNNSSVTHAHVRDLGADFILQKTQRHYSPMNVLKHLSGELKHYMPKPYMLDADITSTLPVKSSDDYIRSSIISYLNNLGMPTNIVGHDYIVDAVILYIYGVRKNLLPELAKRNKITAPALQTGIEYAIRKTWDTQDPEVLLELYKGHLSAAKPTPTLLQFISYVASIVTPR